jgi:hypothetical protein
MSNTVQLSDSGNSGMLTIGYRVRWSEAWINSLWETAHTTANKTGGLCMPFSNCAHTVYASNIKITGTLTDKTAWYIDTAKMDTVRVTLRNDPKILLTLRDGQNNILVRACTVNSINPLYSVVEWPVINAATVNNGTIVLDGISPQDLSLLNSVEISIVPPIMCNSFHHVKSTMTNVQISDKLKNKCTNKTGYSQDLAGGARQC